MGKLEQKQFGMSFCCGESIPDSVSATRNLSSLLHRAASGEQGIVFCLGTSSTPTEFLSYRDLLFAAQRILSGLRGRGLQPQDLVMLQIEHPRHFLACLWGCFLGGFVPVPLGVGGNSGSHSKLQQIWELCDFPLVVRDLELPSEIAGVQVKDLLANDPDSDWYQGNTEDLALLLFTSGSTGQPKGVKLSVGNLLASMYGMAQFNQLTATDITLNWMPLEHVASLVMFHLTEVYLGCRQIQVNQGLILQNPLQWLNLIDRYRVTATWSPNFAYNLVNEQLSQGTSYGWDLSCLRWMGNGAEAVVGQTTRRFLELLKPYGLSPAVVSPGYGMSETSSGITHAHDLAQHLNRELVSVGKPIPGVALRIVNEAGELLPEGERGLLQVKGATVTTGYYQQPELDQEVFTADGWFNTGDLGFLEAGKLTITGRQKDVIIINGVNYLNHEIEAVVEAIAGVTVSYTAACGVKDPQQQEQVAIFFHPQESDPESLRQLMQQIRKRVFEQIGVSPAYLIPVSQGTIPKTAIGKIQRSQLAQRFAAGEFAPILNEVRALINQRTLSQQELPVNAIEQYLVTIWQSVLNLATVSVTDNFFELGGNSLLLMEVLGRLKPDYSSLSAVSLFQYPTIRTLAHYLNSQQESDARLQGQRRGRLRRQARGNQEVAIIGMSCRFPGANSIEEFWHNLTQGVESISWFTDNEILDAGVDQELLSNPNYVKASPILEDIEGFDADFWSCTLKEAQLLDPQQRLFLECAWESLEDAGYDPLTYGGDISLYGGAATNTYLLNNIYPQRQQLDRQDDMQVINLSSMGGFQLSTANDKDYLTTRASYKLNLTGSSVNVQTACSTSLVTVHLACQSLLNAECDLALAGGVSVHSPQKMGYLYQEGMILSPDGHCRAFDADAAGTIFGSGAGMVVLKLLDRAIEDGDRIYGVIKGSAVNNDGGTKVGYLAPTVDGQTRVIAEALACADIPTQSVGYVEAHGTGTKLGDPIEVTALSQAYHDDTRKTGYCAVGSVKTNVGHLQMASGIVGLIKATLCLYHRQLVPSLHFRQPNPQLNLGDSPFYVNTQLQDWQVTDYPRRAGVNSLGIGGTNAHLILEEFMEEKLSNIPSTLPAYLLTLSAKNEPALKDLVSSYQDYLERHSEVSLADVCLTSNVGRHHFDYRLGIVAQDRSELLDKLGQVSLIKPKQEQHKIAFLFTGQGSQYIDMAQQLYDIYPGFKDTVDLCWSFIQSDFNDLFVRANSSSPLRECKLNLEQTEYAQPLLFIIEYALAKLWISWGVKPEILLGHSLGEYVAATIAEVFDLESALKLVIIRGKLMQSLPDNGAMLAIFATREQIANLLEPDIYLAADNGSHSVMSGLKSKITQLAVKLTDLGIKNQLLNVSCAFHSPLMEPMIAKFKTVATTINYALPKMPIVSNITGKLADKSIATADYWLEHILRPVQFASGVNYLAQQQVNICLEIGVKPILITMAESILDDQLLLSSLSPHIPDWQQLLATLRQLYTAGVEINWQAVNQNNNGSKISLPTYPWQRQRYWFELQKRTNLNHNNNRERPYLKSPHPLLSNPLASPLKQIIFPAYLEPDTINYLQDHVINNQVIFPGTAYLEIAIAAGIKQLTSTQLSLKSITIDQPLIIDVKSQLILEIQLIFTPQADINTWEIYSLKEQEWQLHCQGEITKLTPRIEITAPQLAIIKRQFTGTELESEQHYQQCQQRGINYGQSFQGIKQLWAKENQALGLIELPYNLDNSAYHFHPALLDSCLQILFAALPEKLATTAYVPVAIEQLDLYQLTEQRVWSYLKLEQDHNQHKTILADVWLYSDRGLLIAKISGLKSQQVNSKPHWHNWLYQPQWQKKPLSPNKPVVNLPGTWLIFNDSRGVGEQLANLLKKQQHPYQIIDYRFAYDFSTKFAELRQNKTKIAGLIYLWSLEDSEGWQDPQRFLYLLQAVNEPVLNIPLWFVTQHAQPVGDYQLTPGIRQSSLWGMQKAISLEYPELSCVGIDLDSLDHAAENIWREICAREKEQVAYRLQQRYVSRLVRSQINTPNSSNLQLQLNQPGNLDSLSWQTTTLKLPRPHEIEIEVQATGLNFRDVLVALDLYPDDSKFLGLECTGIITQVGTAITNLQPGEQVIAIGNSSFSQYLTVDARLAIPLPKSLTMAQGATIPVTFLTAYYTLVKIAQLAPGAKVLIHAAAGGVGLAAVQIAQHCGAEIFATASPSKWSLLQSLGVTQIMNSRSLDFAASIMSATQGQGVDVVLNSLAGEFIPQSLEVLSEGGYFIEIGKQNIWSSEAVAQIKPQVNYAVVDLWQITQEQPELIQQLLTELRSQFNSQQLKPLPHKIFSRQETVAAFRYMQQGKHQGKIIIAAETNKEQPSNSKQKLTLTGTYLITGGMGAIGLQVAQWLTTKGIKHIVLLGRNEIKPELQANLQKIQGSAQTKLIKADVADTNQLTQAFLQIETDFPPLKGIIHCAGIISDRPLLKQTWSSFEQVLAPKAQGAWNLHQLSQKYALDHFILFSSASSLIGSAAQANYCAANAFLDTLAHGRRSLGLPAISINWGAWHNTGFAANSKVTARLKHQGIETIAPPTAIAILEQLLINSPPQIGVVPINWQVWQQQHQAAAFLANLINSEVKAKPAYNQKNLKQRLLAANKAQCQTIITEQIITELTNILGIKDKQEIDLELGFSELGLDSLASVELKNKIQTSFDIKLSTTDIFNYSSVKKLAQYLLTILRPDEKTVKELEENNNKNQDKTLEYIETLSEAEAEELLLAELNNIEL